MGLAVSNARLLMLHARKSDLEFQMQKICQRRLNASMRTEDINLTYTQKLQQLRENPPLKPKVDEDGDGQKDEKKVGFWGKLWNGIVDVLHVATDIALVVGGVALGIVLAPATFGASLAASAAVIGCAAAGGLAGAGLLALDDPLFNAMKVKEQTKEVNPEDIDTDELDRLENELDAKKDAELATVNTLDRQAEMENNQIETQHKGVETEIDSVKKTIDKNIEMSFKLFQ